MENEKTQISPIKKTELIFQRDDVKERLNAMLGDRATGFITSVLSAMNSNEMLRNADPNSVYMSAMMSASVDLPINQNLGFAYIIPYNQKTKGKNGQPDTWDIKAQFQIGAKGFRQLALRSGLFKRLHATDVRQGEIEFYDRLTGDIDFNWLQNEDERDKLPVIGYVSYFELLDGFKSTFYMSVSQLNQHGKKYSQTFKNGFGNWKDNFGAMCLKTVSKLNLSKNAPLSIETQSLHNALKADQSVINDFENLDDVEYIDNQPETPEVDPLTERIALMIESATDSENLINLGVECEIPEDLQQIYSEKLEKLQSAGA